jgi:DNA-directed RNA polymerase specialized sigma24 family protein
VRPHGVNVDPAPEAVDAWRLLAQLSRRRREIVVSRFYLGRDVEAIAGELCCSPRVVEAVIDDARTRLARIATAAWDEHALH